MAETYPRTGHPSDHGAAIHYAMGLIGCGDITEPQLRLNLAAFRKFVDAGGYSDTSKIPTSQVWFKRDHPKRYWAHTWPPPKPTKARPVYRTADELEAEYLARGGDHAAG